MAVPEAAKDARRLKRRRRFVEAISIVLLACAGVATSWSSYQASRWGGEQAASYSRANGLRVESTRAAAAADQLRAIDVAVFMAWLEAYVACSLSLPATYASSHAMKTATSIARSCSAAAEARVDSSLSALARL